MLDPRGESSLKQLLSYITQLIHKLLDTNIKLVNNVKTGFVNTIAHQQILVEKVNRIKELDDEVKTIIDHQVALREVVLSMSGEVKAMKVQLDNLGDKIILQQRDELIKVSKDLNDRLNDIKIDIMQNVARAASSSNKHLTDLLNKQFELDSQEKIENIKSTKEIKQEKVKGKFAIWAAVIIGIIGGLFGLIQMLIR